MRAGYLDQPAKKAVRRLVLDKMMGQNACRLVGTDAAEPARPQMSDKAAQRRALSDEAAACRPCDEIDMDIDLDQPRRRLKGTARLRAGNRVDPAFPKDREEASI